MLQHGSGYTYQFVTKTQPRMLLCLLIWNFRQDCGCCCGYDQCTVTIVTDCRPGVFELTSLLLNKMNKYTKSRNQISASCLLNSHQKSHKIFFCNLFFIRRIRLLWIGLTIFGFIISATLIYRSLFFLVTTFILFLSPSKSFQKRNVILISGQENNCPN